MVHRSRHVGEEVRVPVGVAGDERPELHPLGDLGHRRQQRPALEVLTVRVSVQRIEVVPVVERVRTHLLDPEPRVAHLRVAGLLRMKLRPDPYRHDCPPVMVTGKIMPRAARDEVGALARQPAIARLTYNNAHAAVATPRVPVRITSPSVMLRNAFSEVRLRRAVPMAFPTMAAGTSASPRGTSGASTRPLTARTASPAMLMGRKYNTLVPRNSCFGRPREASSRTTGGAARPVEVDSAPLAKPATSVPQRVFAPGRWMSRTSSRAEKVTMAPTPRRM